MLSKQLNEHYYNMIAQMIHLYIQWRMMFSTKILH